MSDEKKPKPDLKKILRILEMAVIVVGIVSTIILLQSPPKLTSKASSTATFTLNTDTSLVNSASKLRLDVNLNPFGNPISVLDLVLEYNPTILSYLESDLAVGSMLPVKLGQTKIENIDSTHNNLTITLIAECNTNGCLPALAPDKLVSLNFGVLTPNTNTQISISPRTKVLSAQDTSVNAEGVQYNSNVAYLNLGATTSATRVKPAADTYVKEAYPTKNYSSENSITASNYDKSNTQVAYLKFDLSSYGGSLSKSQLKLVPKMGRTVNKNFKIVTNTSWSEDGLTWKNQPDAGVSIGSYVGKVETDTPILVDLDQSALSVYVGKVVTIKIDNVDGDNDTLQIYSREASGKEPELVLGVAQSSAGLTLDAKDDVYVQSVSDRAKKNYGIETTLVASNYESSNTKTAYMKFDASKALGKSIKKATLYLTASMSRNVEKQVKIISNNNWTEKTVTYNTKPAMGEIVGVINYTKNDLPINTPIAITLNTSKIAISANGEISLGLDNSSSSNTLSVYSKEAINSEFWPKLVIETY